MGVDRRLWMTPVIYNDDRWVEPNRVEEPATPNVNRPLVHDIDGRDATEVAEILSRPEREEKDYECTDTTPVNYRNGPHDHEFGVEDADFDESDSDPVPYSRGPHDDEFGVEDDDDLEQADDDNEEFDNESFQGRS